MSNDVIDPTGVIVDEFEGFEDYYSFGGTKRFTFPDGKQWIEFKVMNEGEKSEFQRKTNREFKISQRDQTATIKADPAQDRHALLEASIVGWHMASKDPKTGKWDWLTFNKAMLDTWLRVGNPKVIEDVEDAIRKANPWLGTEDVTLEDIEKQREELDRLELEVRKREAGK